MSEKITGRLRSINTFSNQWSRFNQLHIPAVGTTADNSFRRYLGSFDPENLRDCRVAEIGAGVGQSLFSMSRYAPRELIGYEPSEGFSFLQRNMQDVANCRLVKKGGHDFDEIELDFVLSIGVIHHIPDPLRVVQNAYQSLRPGGKFVIWVYGNQLRRYVWLQKIARKLTARINDSILDCISGIVATVLTVYSQACVRLGARWAPMYSYLTSTFKKASVELRKILVFDQLNPGWSEYYSESQLRELLMEGGFSSVVIEDVGGYSWTAMCTR